VHPAVLHFCRRADAAQLLPRGALGMQERGAEAARPERPRRRSGGTGRCDVLDRFGTSHHLQHSVDRVGTIRTDGSGHAAEGVVWHVPQPVRASPEGALGNLTKGRARHDDPWRRCSTGASMVRQSTARSCDGRDAP
jgi:hypothetical protein